ncbi:MAG: 4Fe-4S binding protein [Methanobacteriaceae archaeon]|jgi:Pyruvate/2-oxoacid:ferredoxin oxidoreductase delta subunit
MPVIINFDKESCTGCKKCILVCPEPNVISYKKGSKKIEIDRKNCKGCGLCSKFCPFNVLEIAYI